MEGAAGSVELVEDSVGEPRPRIFRPVAEPRVRETCARDRGLRIDPQEAPALAEMAEGGRRVSAPGPVRALVVAKLEAKPPVVRVHTSEPRQDAGEAGEGDRGRLGERL